jgi:WD40-like Beta Propeller Repeat
VVVPDGRSRSIPRWQAAGLVAVAMSMCLVAVAPADAAFPGRPGRLGYSVNESVTFGPSSTLIRDYDRRTKVHRQLTSRGPGCSARETWSDGGLDYSADGRQIAYLHFDTCPGGDSRTGLWVMQADGSGKRQVAPLQLGGYRSPGFWPSGSPLYTPYAKPAFSPDGRRIAVLLGDYETAGFDRAVTVFDAADGTPLFRSLWPSESSVAGLDWSVSGRLAYDRRRIWTAWQDGSGVRAVTLPRGVRGLPSSDQWPDWSPSGRGIAFVRTFGAPGEDFASAGEINTVPARGGRSTRRRDGGWLVTTLAYSPGGRTIAFPVNPGDDSSGEGPLMLLTPARGKGRPRRLFRLVSPTDNIFTLDWQALPTASKSATDRFR